MIGPEGPYVAVPPNILGYQGPHCTVEVLCGAAAQAVRRRQQGWGRRRQQRPNNSDVWRELFHRAQDANIPFGESRTSINGYSESMIIVPVQ